MSPQEFLASIEAHQQAQEQAPDPEHVFVESQVAILLNTLIEANQKMQSFLGTLEPKVEVKNFPKEIQTPDSKEVVKAIKKLETSLKPVKTDNSDVVKGLKALDSTLKSQPEPIESVSVSNLKEVTAELSKLQKAIEKLDLKPNITVDAPKIPEPKVTVQPTDVSGVIKALDKVKKAVDTKPIPVANVPTDPLIYYTPADIDDASAVQYFGYTDNKGAWYIKKFDTGSSPKTIRFCFGQSNYATNFTNRASLAYVLWGS